MNKVALWNRSLKEVTFRILDDLVPRRAGGTFTLIDRQNFPFSYAADVLPFRPRWRAVTCA